MLCNIKQQKRPIEKWLSLEAFLQFFAAGQFLILVLILLAFISPQDNDEEQSYKILFNTKNDNYDRLMNGLELLDPSAPWYFPACTERLKSVVELYSIRRQCKYEIDGPTIWYYLPKEKAITFQIP